MSTRTKNRWDVMIIGAGPAGTTAAQSLAQQGHRIVLLERRNSTHFKLGESVPPQARPLIEQVLGIESGSCRSEHEFGCFESHGNVSCWGSSRAVEQSFMFMPNGYGLRLNRTQFDQALRDRAQSAGAQLFTGCDIHPRHGISRIEGEYPWQLSFNCGGAKTQCHQARFILDCSGRHSLMARICNVDRLRTDRLFAYSCCYQQQGKAKDDRDSMTHIEAMPNGWWYSARLPTISGERPWRLVVFHSDRDLAPAQEAKQRLGFENLLTQSTHIGPMLKAHAYRLASPVRGAAANSARLTRFGGNNWLAVGDAAQSFDPLSSQGIATAVNSALSAAQAAHDTLSGNATAVDDYCARQESIQHDYQKHYHHFYAAEARWPDHRFWRRRHHRLDPVMFTSAQTAVSQLSP